MNRLRFEDRSRRGTLSGYLRSLAAFLVIFLLFIQGIYSVSDSTVRRQKESLENAIMRDIVYCYSVEGSYPESLEYMQENYGLTYDKELFFVDYRVNGANLLPDVTIIERK